MCFMEVSHQPVMRSIMSSCLSVTGAHSWVMKKTCHNMCCFHFCLWEAAQSVVKHCQTLTLTNCTVTQHWHISSQLNQVLLVLMDTASWLHHSALSHLFPHSSKNGQQDGGAEISVQLSYNIFVLEEDVCHRSCCSKVSFECGSLWDWSSCQLLALVCSNFYSSIKCLLHTRYYYMR